LTRKVLAGTESAQIRKFDWYVVDESASPEALCFMISPFSLTFTGWSGMQVPGFLKSTFKQNNSFVY